MKYKKQEGGTYFCFIDSIYGFFIDTTCGFFIDKCYIWKECHKSRKWTRKWDSSVISITLMIKVLGKGVTGAGKRYNNMDHMDKTF